MQIQLHLSPDAATQASKQAGAARLTLIDSMIQQIDDLPPSITIEEGRSLAVALDIYATLGADFVHIMRYFLGVLALRVKYRLGHGSDAIGQCADAWNISPTTLRFYAAAAKKTREKVGLFDSFLRQIHRETGRPATQEHVKAFGRALDDPEITPPAVREQVQMQMFESATASIGQSLAALDDPEHVETAVAVLAKTVAEAMPTAPHSVSRGTLPTNGFSEEEQYERRVEALIEFFDATYAEWYDWHKPDTDPPERQEIIRILRWSSGVMAHYPVPHPLNNESTIDHEQEAQ